MKLPKNTGNILVGIFLSVVFVVCGLKIVGWKYDYKPKGVNKNSEVCMKPYLELLASNTEDFSVSFFYFGWSNSIHKGWYVRAQSRDSQLKFELQEPDLCEALERAWTRIESYNAYVAQDQHR